MLDLIENLIYRHGARQPTINAHSSTSPHQGSTGMPHNRSLKEPYMKNITGAYTVHVFTRAHVQILCERLPHTSIISSAFIFHYIESVLCILRAKFFLLKICTFYPVFVSETQDFSFKTHLSDHFYKMNLRIGGLVLPSMLIA